MSPDKKQRKGSGADSSPSKKSNSSQQNGELKPAIKKSLGKRLGDFITKKVSFGSTKGGTVVETYVYDTNDRGPPSKVKVTSSDQEVPLLIPPPALVKGDSSMDGVGVSTSHHSHVGPTGVVHSPPLPSLQKIEDERDNPFRPQDELYVAVDPIVEEYRTRPFPQSPSHPSSNDKGGAGDHKEETAAETDGKGGGHFWNKKKDSDKKKNKGKDKEETEPLQQETVIRPQQVGLQLADGPWQGGKDPNQLQDEPKLGTIHSPKAGRVELVHLDDKKKKCGCCSVQ